ncbi:MAG: MmgE/PrpD family protein [Dehalococcoidia bacterium]|nr:MmgE/PrpD family protein [Dehalococcoidia bacterium]
MDETMPTARLAEFVASCPVPARARETARRYLLDWLGSAIGGAHLDPPTILRGVVEELGGTPQATVLATGARTSAPLAAMANAAASHVLELDDLDRASITHPGAPVIAAALAVAERDGAGGAALLEAVAVGYEVCIRVGEALGPSHYEHWHTTATAGTLGAAAAAARLGGLPPEAILDALGSAGTMAAGLWEFLADGAMSKQLHPAKAAHDGILATLLAGAGFTGATRILEGQRGLLAAMSGSPDPSRLTAGLDALTSGGPWRIEGVSFKVHASCRHTHPAVDAALRLRARGLDPADIDAVHVRIYSQGLALLEGVEPTTPYAAKFSLPFCIAAALRHGDLSPARFTARTIEDGVTLELASRVTFAPDPTLDVLYPACWPSVVTVRTRNGAVLEERVDHPDGDPEALLTDAQLAAKFTQLTEEQLGAAAAANLARRVLQDQPAPSAADLVRAATAGARPHTSDMRAAVAAGEGTR